jgi:CysZ protein
MTQILNAFREIVFGFLVPVRALWLIVRTPRLIAWSTLPILLTLTLFGLGFFHAHELLRNIVQSFWGARGWNPQGLGSALFRYLVELLLFLASAMSFTFIASLLATPFNDFLAEASESYATPPLSKGLSLRFSQRLRLITLDVGKALFSGISTFLLIFLSWIPGVQVIAYPLTAVLVALQFLSFPATRRGSNLGQDLRLLRRHVWVCLGFGWATAMTLAVPFVSAFFLPVAVVGGTLLYARCVGRDREGSPS